MTLKSSTIPKKYVYVQATTPTDKTEGKLWYNTSDNILYTSDGSTYSEMQTDVNYLRQMINENSLEILENDASNSLAGGQSANMIRDIYSDADGYLNTINTANTTAIFNATTKSYDNYFSDSLVSPQDLTSYTSHPPYVVSDSSNYGTSYQGWVCFAELTGGTQTYNSNATTYWVKIDFGAGNEKPITKYRMKTGGDATRNPIDFQIQGSNDNSTWTTMKTVTGQATTINTWFEYTFANSTSYRYWRVNVTKGAGNYGGFTFNEYWEDLPPANLYINYNAQNLDFTPTHFQIYTYGESVEGAGYVYYNVSFKASGGWLGSMLANVVYAIPPSKQGTILRMVQKLPGSAPADKVSTKGYGIMLW